MPNFNTADKQSFQVIPHGTFARVRLQIKPGGHNDESQDWTGGYAKKTPKGTIYLDCLFTVTEGEYKKRKVWSKIGLHSENGPAWKNIGYAFMRTIPESAHEISPKDVSERADQIRNAPFSALDGVEFTAKIDVETDDEGNEKNVIKYAIPVDHKAYKRGSPSPSQDSSIPSWGRNL